MFGIGAIIGIGSSVLGGFLGGDDDKSIESLLAEAKLENQRFKRQRRRLLIEQRRERGANMVSAGSSGLDTESFSDLFDSNEIIQQLDLSDLRFNSNLVSQEIKSRSDKIRAERANERKARMIGTFTDIGTSLLGDYFDRK
jgi:hypothetical protein